MGNTLLFIATVVIYSWVWFMTTEPSQGVFRAKTIKCVALVALLALPVNINGNVFTIAGNVTAEKSVYSVFSLYQKAEYTAVTVFGLAGYQKAGGIVVTGLGLAGYQEAGYTLTVFGLAGYQRAWNRAEAGVAVVFYQRVGKKTRTFGALSALSKE